MKKKSVRNDNGFIVRRRASESVNPTEKLHPKSPIVTDRLSIDNSARRADDFSLDDIDLDETPDTKKSKKHPKSKLQKSKKKRSLAKRIILTVVILISLVIVGIVVYLGFIAARTSSRVFEGGIGGFLQRERLQVDTDGRTNILIFGTMEDSDEDGGHDGEFLTDTIMVISLHQDDRDAYMFHIPRDLWIELEEPCVVGFRARINTQFMCSSNDGELEREGSEALKRQVSRITGLDLQYFIHVNLTAFVEIIDAVGGVQIVIESDDPRGIYDPTHNWRDCYWGDCVRYPNGLTPVMSGERALLLARSRGAYGGFGLPMSNFDREANQQKILHALFERAVSTNTLTNLNRVSTIINSVGNNVRTNIRTSEVRTFLDIGTNTNASDIQSISFIDPDEPILRPTQIGDQSVVVPIAGTFEYGPLQSFIRRRISSDQTIQEAARIAVFNASDVAGLAGRLSDQLTEHNLNVTQVSNTSHRPSASMEIFTITDKPATLRRLEGLFPDASIRPRADIPVDLAHTSTDLIIVISSEDAL
ncbi:LCP family protein [Candidatus Saccharibacteria bacterium]|nr:LCP family protein [Candidatus Saccharibacteria bacterium]